MKTAIFDRDKCLGCGRCVAECNIITLEGKGKGHVPEIHEPARCVVCGHCVSVCPVGAVSHQAMRPDQIREMASPVGPDEMAAAIRTRRTIRRYKDQPVAREDIERLIEVACHAPSDNNSQDRHFVVVTDRALINALESAIVDGFRQYLKDILAKGTPETAIEVANSRRFVASHEQGGHPIFRNAPCVIFIHGNKSELFSQHNCVLVAGYLMLQAHAMGLGTCVIGRALYEPGALGDFLGVPPTNRIFTILTLGYSASRYLRTVDRIPADIVWKSA